MFKFNDTLINAAKSDLDAIKQAAAASEHSEAASEHSIATGQSAGASGSEKSNSNTNRCTTTKHVSGPVVVGVHVRRGDKVTQFEFDWGRRIPNATHIQAAMDMCRERYLYIYI